MTYLDLMRYLYNKDAASKDELVSLFSLNLFNECERASLIERSDDKYIVPPWRRAQLMKDMDDEKNHKDTQHLARIAVEMAVWSLLVGLVGIVLSLVALK